MHEVLKKCDELYTELVDKNRAAEVLNKQLSEKKAFLEDAERKQRAAWANLAARERVVGKAEDYAKQRQEVKDSIARTTAQKVKNQQKEEELKKLEASLKTQEAELETLKAVYSKKDKDLDEAKAQLEVEKKLMKEKLLEEIKRKL